jgi:hypothetical protein
MTTDPSTNYAARLAESCRTLADALAYGTTLAAIDNGHRYTCPADAADLWHDGAEMFYNDTDETAAEHLASLRYWERRDGCTFDMIADRFTIWTNPDDDEAATDAEIDRLWNIDAARTDRLVALWFRTVTAAYAATVAP